MLKVCIALHVHDAASLSDKNKTQDYIISILTFILSISRIM